MVYKKRLPTALTFDHLVQKKHKTNINMKKEKIFEIFLQIANFKFWIFPHMKLKRYDNEYIK